MPRIARKNLDTTFFHIMVQGIEKKYIFDKKIYKKKYLELIFKECEEFKINIIAYCIMDNHAHILININTIQDMSKFMHKVNGLFAQYYNFLENNRVGFVFRNRFISEPIFNEKYLLNCIKYIHNNPVNAKLVKSPEKYEFSSYNLYKNGNMTSKIIGELIDIEDVIKEEKESFTFYDIDVDFKDIIKRVIKEYELNFHIPIKEIIKSKYVLKKMIIELKENYKIKYKDIAE